MISHRAFGTNFKSTLEESKITIGGYDQSVVPDFKHFRFTDITLFSKWQVSCSDIGYDNVNMDLSASSAILTTGDSLVRFESNNGDWSKIYNNITSGKTCGYSTASGLRACACNSTNDFKDITLTLGGHNLVIEVDTWVKNESSGICAFYIDSMSYSNSISAVVLGYSFMRNYYIYHDLANSRVGFYRPQFSSQGYLPTGIALSLIILIFAFSLVF